jgi:uncharacterized protein (TIGR00161 family)
MVEVKTAIYTLADNIKLKNPVLIVGMPSPGLVGTIAGVHLTQKNKFELVGYMTSDTFAPVAAIHDYTLLPPVRVMASEELNIVFVISEINIPVSASNKVGDAIIEVAKKFNVKEIAVLSSTSDEKKGLYHVTSTKELETTLRTELGSKTLQEGALGGVGSLVLMKGKAANIPTYSLIAVQEFGVVDPNASAALLKALSKLYEFKVDIKELIDEAKAMQKAAEKEFSQEVNTGDTGMYR